MAVPAPFFVNICSICGNRVNVESRKADQDGHTVHEECSLSREHAKKSEGPLTLRVDCDLYES